MLTVLTFFLILSILVLIHEFGHYIAAKKSGMKVEEFGLGLPPRIVGIKKKGTVYSLNLLPFGGFVKIFGEDPADTKTVHSPETLKKAFNNRPWYSRLAVIIAGPMMNFVLAVLVISYLFSKGTYVTSSEVKVVEVEKRTPASLAGLQKNDQILGLIYQKEQAVFSAEELTQHLKKLAGKKVVLKIKRGSRIKYLEVWPRQNPPKNQGALGIAVTDLKFKRFPWYEAPIVGLKESVKISILYYQELLKIFSRLLTGQKTAVEVAGPIGIAKLTGEAVQNGFTSVLSLLGLLSLNLALINIFPFPALDGGQMAFILFEAASKRKINEDTKAKINTLGFAFLISLIILVSIQDLIKLFK